jgi:hypothetical protein
MERDIAGQAEGFVRRLMRKAPKLEQGAVLAIPVDKDRWALSQVLVPGTSFYLGAAAVRFRGLPQLGEIDQKRMTIFSWTNDAEVYRGNWRLLGTHSLQASPNPDIRYKVEISGRMMVETFDGTLLRELNPRIDEGLSYRTSRSPLLVQDMIQAAIKQSDRR